MLWSIGGTALKSWSVTATCATVVLVDGHVPETPIFAADFYAAGKVICCMPIAGFEASASFIIALPTYRARNDLPILWLIS